MVGTEDAVFTFGGPHDTSTFQLVKSRTDRFVCTQLRCGATIASKEIELMEAHVFVKSGFPERPMVDVVDEMTMKELVSDAVYRFLYEEATIELKDFVCAEGECGTCLQSCSLTLPS